MSDEVTLELRQLRKKGAFVLLSSTVMNVQGEG